MFTRAKDVVQVLLLMAFCAQVLLPVDSLKPLRNPTDTLKWDFVENYGKEFVQFSAQRPVYTQCQMLKCRTEGVRKSKNHRVAAWLR